MIAFSKLLISFLLSGNHHEDDEYSEIKNINSNLFKINNDYLSHLNLDTIKINFKQVFGDVKVRYLKLPINVLLKLYY